MTATDVSTPAVSCVLIFLDGQTYLDEAIRSVVTQEGFDDWELILVDDGSTDASTAIAEAWAATDVRIRYVEHPGHANRGMSASRNLGVERARGIYVGFLDCDDVWLPAALAHRMRVAAAHPDAEIVVGGTWRWHSWTGVDGDLGLDERMPLPVAPFLTTIEPPRLFSAIYGTPGGGRVPAMCSLLIRREALLAIDGMAEEFRGLYEDQVLYVKAGLQMRAVLDERPLALYRQHPGSTCSVLIANGEWNRTRMTPPAQRFYDWMSAYVRAHVPEPSRAGAQAIVQANIDAFRPSRARRTRDVVGRHAPRSVISFVHWSRGRFGSPRHAHPARPLSVIATWSAQFLGPIVRSMTDTVVVVAPPSGSGLGEPWSSELPPASFARAVAVSRCRPADIDPAACFDHVVVPACTAQEIDVRELFSAIGRLLAPGGSAVALLPNAEPAELVALAAELLPDLHLALESFGNPITAQAVARGLPAGDVRGVAIDRHDGQTHVLLGLVLSSVSTDDRAQRAADPSRAEDLA
ncbi:MAG: glycosyl transferase family 2 [Ilumatobacteraceae bacterium]|nr:glycosyl transferase family 2 [Ilumatobacteraceae bacterium]